MSLHFDLYVGRTKVGHFEAHRTTPLVDGQREYEYDCLVEAHGEQAELMLRHNRDDGAYVLIAKAIEMAVCVEPRLGIYPHGARRP